MKGANQISAFAVYQQAKSTTINGKVTKKKQKTLKKKSEKIKLKSATQNLLQTNKKTLHIKKQQKNVPINGNPETKQKQKVKNKKIKNTESVQLTENTTYLKSFSPNITENSSGILQWLLAPIKETDFFEKYWEQKPLYIQRINHRQYFKNIFTSKDLDTMLRKNSLFYTRNVDVVSYCNGTRETHNTEGRAVPSAVWDYYSNGCSVRILNPHSYNDKVHLLLATLQERFGNMVGANVYLTPPGNQGFAPHWDDIEAFVLQLEGRKHWKLYGPK